jgi:hypothetical protein
MIVWGVWGVSYTVEEGKRASSQHQQRRTMKSRKNRGGRLLLAGVLGCMSAVGTGLAQSHLLDIDFGANATTQKSGPAALGETANDLWNFYTRDDGHGGYRYGGAVTNLFLADGTPTAAGLIVNDAPGAWAQGSTDPMYNTYLYPLDTGNITITLTNLPPGTYNVLPYAWDGNYDLTVGGTDYGVKTCGEYPVSNPPVWTEGVQFVRYTNVQVTAGQSLVVTAHHGHYGVSTIAGMQIEQVVAPPPPATALIDVDFAQDSGPSPERGFAAVGLSNQDFWNFYTRDDGHGNWLTFGVLSNLALVNGTLTGAGMTVSNAPGDWGNGSTDPMYSTYIYPFNGGNVTIAVTNLPAGSYDVWPYSSDGNFELSVGTNSYGVMLSYDTPVTNPPAWSSGVQFVHYKNVQLSAGQAMVLTVRPGVYGYATISGIQIANGPVLAEPPFIATQPASETALAGTTVLFSVAAGGAAPLSYQWLYNGSPMPGQTASTLTLTDVQAAQQGNYSVMVTNLGGMLLSSNAVLTVGQPPATLLIDVDYGQDAGPSPEKGFAAVGLGANDFWNFYTRDDGHGNWLTFGVLSNLALVDGSLTGAGMTVSNAPGDWGNGSTDPMYSTYIYPFNGGNVTITVTNLPPGTYDFWPYSSDGNFELSVDGTSYGVKRSFDTPVTNPPAWSEGEQYVHYKNVPVAAGQTVTLTVYPGVYGYATISGIQIAQGTVLSAPPFILTQPSSQSVLDGGTALFTVGAGGAAPLSFQWQFDNTNIPGATTAALSLSGVQPSQAGTYAVLVTNVSGSVLSSNAILTVTTRPPTLLIDVDYGQDSGPSPEHGFAATGLTTNDFWNFYTRDDGHGNWLTFGVLSNLALVDHTLSGAGMTVSNAPGDWGDGSTDPMYNTYIYPFNSGNITIIVTNLPSGTYDFLPYSWDGNFEISVAGASYGLRHSFENPVVNPPTWTEGVQYARFRNVSVPAGQAVVLTVRPGVFGLATISGIQIAQSSGTGVSPYIVSQPTNQTVIQGATAQFTVQAGGTEPLSYQWLFNGTPVADATTTILTLTDVQQAQAGSYSVVISNVFGTNLSASAVLSVNTEVQIGRLLDVDFGANATTLKSGYAALGVTTNDLWNFYTRDDGQGGWRYSGALTNLFYVDGTPSGAGLSVNDAPGAWGDGSTDPMYDVYIYPFDGGNITITITNLPAGQYSFLPYSWDGNYELSVNGTSYGVKTCGEYPVANPPVWAQGRQYVEYDNIQVNAGQTVVLTARPGIYNYATICGLQVVQAAQGSNQPPVAATAFLKVLANEVTTIPDYRFLDYCSDPDGDTLSVTAVSSPSTNGGTATLAPNGVIYVPPTNYLGGDEFRYTVSDGLGGTASAAMEVLIEERRAAAAAMLQPMPTSNGMQIRFNGFANRSYAVQRAQSLNGPWIVVGTVLTDDSGNASFVDPNPPGTSAFYRAVYQ